MKSRAELLAEIEENRLENKDIQPEVKGISLSLHTAGGGYDPYDNPGLGKELPDGADITAHRREMMRSGRRR